MGNPLQDKIQELISLRKEGWGDSEDGSDQTPLFSPFLEFIF